MNSPFDDQPAAYTKALAEAVRVRECKPCEVCGGTEMDALGAPLSLPTTGPSFAGMSLTGTQLTVGAVICQRCGNVRLHALKYLGVATIALAYRAASHAAAPAAAPVRPTAGRPITERRPLGTLEGKSVRRASWLGSPPRREHVRGQSCAPAAAGDRLCRF